MIEANWQHAIIFFFAVDGQCYDDSDHKLLSESVNMGNSNSVDTCKAFCGDIGYKYAGVKDRTWCHCGNSPARALKMRPDTECQQYCPGCSTQFCGSKNRMLIFSLRNVSLQSDKGNFYTFLNGLPRIEIVPFVRLVIV